MQAFHFFLDTVTLLLRYLSQVVVAIRSNCNQSAAVVTERTEGFAILNTELSETPLTVEVGWQDFLHERKPKIAQDTKFTRASDF